MNGYTLPVWAVLAQSAAIIGVGPRCGVLDGCVLWSAFIAVGLAIVLQSWLTQDPFRERRRRVPKRMVRSTTRCTHCVYGAASHRTTFSEGGAPRAATQPPAHGHVSLHLPSALTDHAGGNAAE